MENEDEKDKFNYDCFAFGFVPDFCGEQTFCSYYVVNLRGHCQENWQGQG